jgi:hypothetical protein
MLLSVFMSIFPISSWLLRRYPHQCFFLLLSFFVSLFSPSSYSTTYAFCYLLFPCFFLSGLAATVVDSDPNGSTRHISAKKLHPIICPPLIHNKQALASDVRRWTAMTWGIVGMPAHKRLWGWTTHDLPGQKESPTGGQLDCAQGRGPPDAEWGGGGMYCRYRYNVKYVRVAVSSALFPKPRVVSCSFPFGSTRKSKWTQSARHFKLDQDYL